MKKHILILTLVTIIGSLSFLSGCIQNEGLVIGSGTLRLQITDKKTDLDIIYANVTISTVQVHMANADNESISDEEDNNDDGFTADANGEYKGEIGEDIQFLGTVTNGEEPHNWTWNFGDGNISYLQNPLHNYTTKGVYTVNLTVVDNASLTAWDKTKATIGEEIDNESGWITIVNNSQTFDLISLQNVTELLGEKNLTAGKYTQIRLKVESAIITINNSGTIEEHTLEIPSNKIKLIKGFQINENETTVLTLDFDVYKSIHQTGNDKYILKPTIKIIQE
jgi:PKD repeat protein